MAIETVGIQFKVDDLKLKNHLSQSIRKTKQLQGEQRKLNNLMRQEATFGSKSATDDRKALDYMRKKRIEQEKFNRALSQQNKYSSQTMTRTPAIRSGSVGGAGVLGAGMMMRMMPLASAYLGYQGIKSAGDRQASFGQVSNMLGKDVSNMTKNDLRGIAIQSGQSNKDIISAYYDALSSQFSEEAGKSIVKTSGILATGGGFGVDVATSALISTMKSYSNFSAEEVGNMLTGTVKAGRVTGEQVASNVGKFLPMASAMGASAEDTLSAFAGITLKGLSAEEAATSLNALFTVLSQGGEEAKKLGISTKTLKEEGIQGILEKINENVAKSSEADELLNTLFPNIRAKKAVLGLSGQEGLETFNMSKNLIQTSKSIEDFDRQTNDVNVQMERLKSQTETLIDTFLETTGALGGMSKGVSFLTDGLNVIGKIIGIKQNREDYIEKYKQEAITRSNNPEEVAQAKLRMQNGTASPLDSLIVQSAIGGGSLGGNEEQIDRYREKEYEKRMDFGLFGLKRPGYKSKDERTEEDYKKAGLDVENATKKYSDSINKLIDDPTAKAIQGFTDLTIATGNLQLATEEMINKFKNANIVGPQPLITENGNPSNKTD